MVCNSLPICFQDVAACFIYNNHLHIYLRGHFYRLTVVQDVQDLECWYSTELRQLERESNHSPLFHAEVPIARSCICSHIRVNGGLLSTRISYFSSSYPFLLVMYVFFSFSLFLPPPFPSSSSSSSSSLLLLSTVQASWAGIA
jgi:hypothetical protein